MALGVGGGITTTGVTTEIQELRKRTRRMILAILIVAFVFIVVFPWAFNGSRRR